MGVETVGAGAVRPAAANGRLGRTWLILMVALSVGVGFYGLWYLTGRAPPPGPANNHAGLGWLLVHATSAGLALLLGPWQFMAGVRAKRPWLHRLTGRSYMAVCLVGGFTGLVLGLNTAAGPLAQGGFTSLAVVWLGVNAMGYSAALRRDFVSHRRWMIRSFALTFAAVTLRLYLPISFAPGFSFDVAYPIISWVAWVPNLAVAEAWIRRHPRPSVLAGL